MYLGRCPVDTSYRRPARGPVDPWLTLPSVVVGVVQDWRACWTYLDTLRQDATITYDNQALLLRCCGLLTHADKRRLIADVRDASAREFSPHWAPWA